MDSLKQYQDSGLDDKSIINCLSQEVSALRLFKEKHELEFSRFKQDCRKRALDLAHQQVNAPEYRSFISENKFVDAPDSKTEKPKPVVKEESLITLADKYYGWLISIPDLS